MVSAPKISGDGHLVPLPEPEQGRPAGRFGRALAAPRWLFGPVVNVWRSSLQLRVVVLTLVLSTIVTVFVGWMLLRQVQEGLLAEKVASSTGAAAAGIRNAQDQVDAAEPEGDAGQFLDQLASDIAYRGTSAGTYEVRVEQGESSRNGIGGGRQPRGSGDILAESVPTQLRDAFPTDRLMWQYTLIQWGDGRAAPGLAVGAQLSGVPIGGTLEVYYLFPFTQEAETLQLVQRSLVAAGAVLVGLLGLVAWLVAHQVVTPVRTARRIAERLSAGRLEERMRVKGRDDLARLATSFNQMAASLQRQIRQLEELSRVQRRFVSDVSHELRTPLTTVRMASDVLHEARQDFDPGVARSAELLQTELNRFEGLLADLLEISRYDAGAATLALEEVDVGELTRGVVDHARTLAARKGSQVYLHVPARPCVASIDKRRIERVVRNLVGNAIEYGEGKDIVIRVVADDDAVAVSVRDHGVGLNPGEAARVFDRFWRSDPARARTSGGTGLGLAIAIEDAVLHGGWLQAWGEPGHGSHFRLTLPRRAGEKLHHSPVPLIPEDARDAAESSMVEA